MTDLVPAGTPSRHRPVFILIAQAMEEAIKAPISGTFMARAEYLALHALLKCYDQGLCVPGDYEVSTRGPVLRVICLEDAFAFSFTFGPGGPPPPGHYRIAEGPAVMSYEPGEEPP